MDLIDYLRNYSSGEYHIGDRHLHRELVRVIARDISKILKYDSGVDVRVFLEVALQRNNRLCGRVDVVALSNDELTVIEAKNLVGRRPDNVRHYANTQLRKAYYFFRDNFGIAPQMISVMKNVASNHLTISKLPRDIEDYKIWNFSH